MTSAEMTSAAYRNSLKERFLRYVKIYTTSDMHSPKTPSSECQWDLLRILHQELLDLGIQDVALTEKGYVLATVPASKGAENAPTIGLFAHVDTAPDYSGKDVRPIVHPNYDGKVIVLPDDSSKVLDPAKLSYLANRIGHEVITASGTTLLGADDKAGIAIAMTIAEILTRHPEIPHGRIRLCFNPDEEIGRGTVGVEIEEIGASVGYTFDGDEPHNLNCETFSADRAIVEIKGVSIHPGTAEGKLVNAITLATRFFSFLPAGYPTPETTSGRNGFIHATELNGNAAAATLRLIIRDFELKGLTEKGELVRNAVSKLQASEPRAVISLEISEQYRNMRYWLEKDMRPVDMALQAIRQTGVEPDVIPTRGGTDGSVFTARGLPTPNLGSGAYSCHGPLEWTTVEDMLKCVDVGLKLVGLWAKEKRD